MLTPGLQNGPAESPEERSERWRIGTEKYRQFYGSLSVKEKKQLLQPAHSSPDDAETVQLLFLKEKAAVAESYGKHVRRKLEASGISTTPGFLYDDTLVQRCRERYPEDFQIFSGMTNQRMLKLCEYHCCLEYCRPVGRLLGYPTCAIDYFAERFAYLEDPKHSESDIAARVSRDDFYGTPDGSVVWIDEKNSIESLELEERLMQALKLSGIKDVHQQALLKEVQGVSMGAKGKLWSLLEQFWRA